MVAEEVKKEEKKKWRFFLACTKCSFRFSIERDSSDMNKVDIKKMKCMECGKPIMWDTTNFPVSAKPSREAQSKANLEATKIALELAGKAIQQDRRTGGREMVPVRSYQKGKEFGQTKMVPKKVIESIEEKVKDLVE